MKNNSIEKRIRQYNICKAIEWVGYLMIGLSFLFLIGIAGNSDYYEYIHEAGPSVKVIITQTIMCFIVMYSGYRISAKGKEWVNINKRKMIRLINSMNEEVR